MSKQKGFTLIEIIGVVVILSLLLILTVPSLTKTLKRNEQNKYNDYIDNLKIAAENYVVNKLKEGVVINDYIYITLGDLIDEGYVTDVVTNPITNKSLSRGKHIKVLKETDGTFKYEVIELPPEYQEVEYIESTGTQYIDTEFVAADGYKSELKILVSESVQHAYLIGSHEPTTLHNKVFYCKDDNCKRNGLGLKKIGTESKFELGIGRTVVPIYDINVKTNKKYNIEFSTVNGNSYLVIDGTKYLQSSDYDDRSELSIILFGNNDTLENRYYTFRGKIYYCKIYSNDNKLERDFIPCYYENNDKVKIYGMYDTIYHKFYPVQEIEAIGSPID